MASPGGTPGGRPPGLTRWLARGWRACAVTAMVVAVAGCVGMPSSGPVGSYGAGQQNTPPALQYVGPFPSGPGAHWTPSQIVQGFLAASADPLDAPIAKQYLVSSASSTWDPGWSVTVLSHLHVPATAQVAGRQAQVEVTGTVQAAFNGTGQYVSAQSQGKPGSSYPFNLVMVHGQWRISNPPDYRLLDAADFPEVYKPQDLYFFALSDRVLVPDSVFVPLGTSAQDLAVNLVNALSNDPSTGWLQNAADTEFPPHTTVLGVTLDGATAVVNLGGAAARADEQIRELMAAQLVWTLAGSQTSAPAAIQSVVLEINGQAWTPHSPPCGTSQSPGRYQSLASYECYDPYPSAPASFYYAAGGLVWSRCGSDQQAQQGYVGAVMPVVGRTGALSRAGCGSGGFVLTPGPAVPPAQPRSLPAMSAAAVAPSGNYLALVSPGQDAVYVGPLSGAAASFPATPRLTGPDISALSWDRDGDLWVAQGDTVWWLPPDGTYKQQVADQFPGPVAAFRVAPDGVRVAAIVQTGAGSELELAAINPPAGQVQRQSPPVRYSIGQGVQLGPNLTDPVALTWYNADDLIVLDAAKNGNTLWEVPVDGQQATELQVTPPGVVWIAADGPANCLVAGLTGGRLDVSAGLGGQWQPLAANGADPVYPG